MLKETQKPDIYNQGRTAFTTKKNQERPQYFLETRQNFKKKSNQKLLHSLLCNANSVELYFSFDRIKKSLLPARTHTEIARGFTRLVGPRNNTKQVSQRVCLWLAVRILRVFRRRQGITGKQVSLRIDENDREPSSRLIVVAEK